jgi:nucleotide-binding universal stress UspA family protein
MRRILAGLDGSPLAETILPFIETLAKMTGAEITLFHAVSLPASVPQLADYPSIDQVVRRARQLAEDYLHEQRHRSADTGVRTSVAVVLGDPAQEIVRYAEREGFDLVALATHGRSGVQRWAHGSVADRVLHTTTIPLLLIRPGDGWAAVPRGIQQIVVPLDGSPEAEASLRIAEPLASRCHLPLVLVRFVEPLMLDFAADPSGVAYVDFQRITDGMLKTARDYQEGTASKLRQQGVSVSAEVSVAPPADGIATYTNAHPSSLVVLTTHGRSGWRRFLLGSVARRVVQTVAAPIVICPPRQA